MNVHRVLGPGLAEEVYEECLAIELRELEFDFERGTCLKFDYRGKKVSTTTRLSFVIDGVLLLQVRSQSEISKLDEEQLEAQVRLSRLRIGVFVNFNVTTLRKGIHQVTLRRRKADSN